MELADKAALAETVAAASCPPDILKKFKAKTPKKIAINLIRQQYNIRYNFKRYCMVECSIPFFLCGSAYDTATNQVVELQRCIGKHPKKVFLSAPLKKGVTPFTIASHKQPLLMAMDVFLQGV